MKTFCIEREDLYTLDQFLEVENADQLDQEIESIVASLWANTGPAEELLKPFFTTFLQSNLLRPLYINYFSLREIQGKHEQVLINASTGVLDIAASALGIGLNPERLMHDDEFYLRRHYLFSPTHAKGSKSRLRQLAWLWTGVVNRIKGVDVLYLNAGKLDQDLVEVKSKLSATSIPCRRSSRLGWDIEAIRAQVKRNIESLPLSLPTQCVQQLVELRVLTYLPALRDRIGVLAETIEKLRMKLAIATAFTHEDHLCLLAAAKLTGIESLVVAHGVTFAKNIFLDQYVTAQATLNDIEPKYEGAAQFSMRYQWFERKV